MIRPGLPPHRLLHPYPRRRASLRLGRLLLAPLLLLLAACQPAPTPTATPLRAPTAERIIVRRTPVPAPTPTPLPTLPFAIDPVYGNWALDVTFTVHDNPPFLNVRYVGSAVLEVDIRGNIRGSIEFYPAIEQLPCNTAALDTAPLTATITGILRAGAGNEVIANLEFVPDDPFQKSAFFMICPWAPNRPITLEQTVLWPALRAGGQLTTEVPLRPGARVNTTADLAGASGGGLRGQLRTQFTVNRTG